MNRRSRCRDSTEAGLGGAGSRGMIDASFLGLPFFSSIVVGIETTSLPVR